MKKILTALAISFCGLITVHTTYADPRFDQHPRAEQRDDEPAKRMRGVDYERNQHDDLQEKRRIREERGVKRLKQHRWQTGYVMPQHYRGDGYKIDYRDSDLPKPARNQQWYKINSDYILVDLGSNSIVKIQSF